MYGQKYIVQAVGLNNKMFTCEIWEKGYSGSITQIEAGTNPFLHSLINSTDDAFGGIVSSTLDVDCNITNFVGTLPDFSSTDDRKYWVNFYAKGAPGSFNSTILWNMWEATSPFADCNMQILVNGVIQVFQFTNNTGSLTTKAGDIVTILLAVFILPAPAGTNWLLQIQKDGTDIYNVSIDTSTVVIGANQTFTFVASGDSVYTVICKSYSASQPGPTVPVNTQYNLFQGFILTDQVQLPFNTGYKGLKFTCTDGFAMLKNIPYTPINRSTANETLLAVILNCLNQLQLPNNFNLNICLSIFASGMNDRGVGTQYEPFSQTYYAYRNWLTSTGATIIGTVETSPYMSCYDVLSKIVTSFGCVMRQSGSEFFIGSVSEMAGSSIYYTKYNSVGTVVSSGTLSVNKTVAPYTTSAPYYFVNGSQYKMLRKGFPDFQIKCPAAYSPQGIDNGTMSTWSSGYPYGWIYSPYGLVTGTSLGPYNALKLAPTGPSAPYNVANISPSVVSPIYIYDKLNLSFWIDGQTVPSSTVPKCYAYVILTPLTGGYQWYVDKNGNWVQLSLANPNPVPYPVIGSTSNAYQSASISANAAPTSGTITITFSCDYANTLTCTIANVVLTYTSQYQYHLIRNSVTNLSYQKIVELPLGAPSDIGCMTQVGSLVDSSNTPLTNWYRYGITESYDCLLRLIYQQMYNVMSVSSLNFDADVMSLFNDPDSITPFNSFQVTDATGQLSASGNYYLLGNSKIDYCKDQVQVSLLETTNTDLSVTPTEINVPQNNY